MWFMPREWLLSFFFAFFLPFFASPSLRMKKDFMGTMIPSRPARSGKGGPVCPRPKPAPVGAGLVPARKFRGYPLIPCRIAASPVGAGLVPARKSRGREGLRVLGFAALTPTYGIPQPTAGPQGRRVPACRGGPCARPEVPGISADPMPHCRKSRRGGPCARPKRGHEEGFPLTWASSVDM